MDIAKAKQLKIGQIVHCPSDRGGAGYTGKVSFVGAEVNKTVDGVEYVWVTVKSKGHASVWPSNRLG